MTSVNYKTRTVKFKLREWGVTVCLYIQEQRETIRMLKKPPLSNHISRSQRKRIQSHQEQSENGTRTSDSFKDEINLRTTKPQFDQTHSQPKRTNYTRGNEQLAYI